MISIDQISYSQVGANNTTFKHRVSSADSVLIVLVQGESTLVNNDLAWYNGVPLQRLGFIQESNSTIGANVSIFSMINPPVGNFDLLVNTGGNNFINVTAVSLLGVNKKALLSPTSIVTTTSTTSPTNIGINVTSANSLVFSVFAGAGTTSFTTLAVDSQKTLLNDQTGNGVGYSYENPGQKNISWSWTAAGLIGGAAIALALEPAQAPSMWFPNIGTIGKDDVVQQNNLDDSTAINNGQSFGNRASVFFKNSFLHTVGRMQAAGLNASGPYGLATQTFLPSTIKVENVTQAITGSSPISLTHNVKNRDSILVIIYSGNTNVASLSVDGLFIPPQGYSLNSTDIRLVWNPKVGQNLISVTANATNLSSTLTAITLSGVDKSSQNINFKTATATSTASNNLINITTNNSLIIDVIEGAVQNLVPDSSQTTVLLREQKTFSHGISMKVVPNGLQKMAWTFTNGAYQTVAIAFKPASARSIWNSNKETNISGAENGKTWDNNSPSFFRNSFLHTVGRILPIPGGGNITTTQTITGKASILKTATQTITGLSRIQTVVTQTINGLARITKSATQTITGLARITVSTSRTITGLARITVTTSKTITGLARIGLVTSRTITGLARITKATSQTITGLARVTVTTSRTITGKGDILKTATQTITGKANIGTNATQTITGKARITASTTRTLTGIADILKTTARTITGLARIQITSSQTITGKSRIGKVVNQTITGLARITVSTTRTITGLARITISTTKTITGKARVTIVTNQTILGVANIIASGSSVAQTITGKARITKTTQRTITGKALIMSTIPPESPKIIIVDGQLALKLTKLLYTKL